MPQQKLKVTFESPNRYLTVLQHPCSVATHDDNFCAKEEHCL